jgi:hypothetical protein
VIEGQLGQDEEVLAAQCLPRAPERGEDRILVEARREPQRFNCSEYWLGRLLESTFEVIAWYIDCVSAREAVA